MTQCSKAKCLLSTFAVFVFLVAVECVLHHCPWLHNLYMQTGAVWRPVPDIEAMAPWIFGHYAVLSFVIVCLYKKLAKAPMTSTCAVSGEVKKCCPIARGLCFGLAVGLLMGVMKTDVYPYLPIPLELATAWFASCVVEGLGIGLILAFIYKPKPDAAA